MNTSITPQANIEQTTIKREDPSTLSRTKALIVYLEARRTIDCKSTTALVVACIVNPKPSHLFLVHCLVISPFNLTMTVFILPLLVEVVVIIFGVARKLSGAVCQRRARQVRFVHSQSVSAFLTSQAKEPRK